MKIWRIVVKEMKVLYRDAGGLIMLFVVPIALMIVFNYAMGGAFRSPEDRPISVPVANLDRGALGAAVVDELGKSEWISVETTDSEDMPFTFESAIARVESGGRNQAIIIPEDFTERITAGEEITIPVYLDPAVPTQFTGPVIGALQGALIGATMADQIKAGLAGNEEKIIAGIEDMSREFAQEKGYTTEGWRNFITPEEIFQRFIKDADFAGEFEFDDEDMLARIEERQPPSVKREEFPSVYQQTASGYAVMFVFFIIMTIGFSFLRERRDGTYRRLLAAPVSKASILIGKLTPNLIVNCVQVAIMFGTGILLFGIDLGSSPVGMLLITLCLSLCACGMGLLIANLFRTENQLSAMGVLIVLTTSALSGAMIPRFIMGELMQQVSLAIPQTWAIEGYQQIMVRGGGILDILPNCGILLLFAALFFGVALWRFRLD